MFFGLAVVDGAGFLAEYSFGGSDALGLLDAHVHLPKEAVGTTRPSCKWSAPSTVRVDAHVYT